MRAVVRDEDLLAIVHHDSVGEFKVFGAAELGEDVTHLVEDDYAHHLQNTTMEKWHRSIKTFGGSKSKQRSC